MNEHEGAMTGRIHNHGHHVPIIAFYSVQGGVGKSTLARKFAELVTVAPGREGRKPNVLVVDLDVEAQGLTYRLTQGMGRSIRTVHEILAERNAALAQAMTVTTAVSLASGNPQHRGQLYLMPAAPPDAKGLFDTIATIDREDLLRLLKDMIQGLVMQYDIGCVVIDCAPGGNPYTAAAATLADVPLLIGRNEQATYDQIGKLPERFREWYPAFQPARQRVIINAVAVLELLNIRMQRYSVLDYIPLISDVIHETESLSRVSSFRMLLFEKYVVDIIKKVLVGMKQLIPEAPEVAGQEWVEALSKLERCEEAPKVRRLRPLGHLRWVGAALLVIGIAVWGSRYVFDVSSAALAKTLAYVGGGGVVMGVILGGVGWYAESQRHRILAAARELVISGPDGILRMLGEGVTHRKRLDELRKLAESIPKEARRPGA